MVWLWRRCGWGVCWRGVGGFTKGMKVQAGDENRKAMRDTVLQMRAIGLWWHCKRERGEGKGKGGMREKGWSECRRSCVCVCVCRCVWVS